MNIKTKKETPSSARPLINVGALFDIPTGSFITGKRGESILNGGFSGVTGIVGGGNAFKSTTGNFLALSAMNRMRYSGLNTGIHTYDTEDNMALNLDRLNALSNRMDFIPDNPLYDEDLWSVISKSQMTAEEWITVLYAFIAEKGKDKSNKVKYDAFTDRIRKEDVVLLEPSIVITDSYTELEPGATANTVSRGDIENSNTVFMQQGLFKTKLLKDLPRISNIANIYFILIAHVGAEINMASGPFAPQPVKALQHIKKGLKIKGVSDKLYFLTTHLWHSQHTSPLINSGTKEAEYPINDTDVNTDLNIVRLIQLRSKSGGTGYGIELVVSQREGVLPSLTEFHFIKTNKFGLDGNVRFYNLDIYPEVKLSRPSVRGLIDSDAKLRRAINITSELLQLSIFKPEYKRLLCTPKELYDGIIEKGYSWDDILENTRGWWTIKNYDTELKFLSILDLLKMRLGEYVPYWYKKDKNAK